MAFHVRPFKSGTDHCKFSTSNRRIGIKALCRTAFDNFQSCNCGIAILHHMSSVTSLNVFVLLSLTVCTSLPNNQ